MNSRTIAYVLAVLILVVVRLAVAKRERRKSGSPGAKEPEASPRSVWRLLLASFLVLFAELAFIRWIAVEVRIFAYFKNLALLLCFVGFGLGCALAKQKVRWSTAVTAFLGLLLVIRIPWRGRIPLEQLSQSLGGGGDVAIWAVGSTWTWANFLIGAVMAGGLFLLIAFVFVPLGQTVSAQMNLAPRPLRAYSWNLFGSLVGVLAFVAASRLMLPPWIWLGAVLLGFAFLQSSRRDRLLVASMIVPLVLLLNDGAGPETQILWTPYQQV